jgi:hypothetical protein
LRRLIDGSYTVAVPWHGALDITPRGMRYAFIRNQLYRSKIRKKLKYRSTAASGTAPMHLAAARTMRSRRLKRGAFLTPAPDAEFVKLAVRNLESEYPALKGIGARVGWADRYLT